MTQPYRDPSEEPVYLSRADQEKLALLLKEPPAPEPPRELHRGVLMMLLCFPFAALAIFAGYASGMSEVSANPAKEAWHSACICSVTLSCLVGAAMGVTVGRLMLYGQTGFKHIKTD